MTTASDGTCPRCGEHHTKCAGHRKSDGRPCQSTPIRGGTVCRMHGGAAPQVRAKATRRLAVADIHAEVERERRLGQFELDGDVDHLQAFCDLLLEDQANVAVLRECVARLEPRYTTTVQMEAGDAVGIAGPNHLGDGAPHVFIVMYDQALDRLARHLKMAHDAGLAERQVDVAERLGAQIGELLNGMKTWLIERLEAAGIDSEIVDAVKAEYPKAARAQLQLVAGSS